MHDSREQALEGGDAGPAFDPADPDGSLLLEQVTGDKPAMPKSAPPLSADEVQTLRD
ncbi:MAG: c-type cytochrome domain-containing protein [Planctomycetaceae bacterium]